MSKKTSAAFCLAALVAVWVFLLERQNSPLPDLRDDAQTPKVDIHIPDDVASAMRAGDVIFRGKDRSWGDLGAQLSDHDKRFGHVGVIVNHNDGWAVIDAIGNPFDPEGRVRLRSFDEFLAPATRAAIYRPDLQSDSHARYLASIWKYEAGRVPFDRFYDIQDAEALYCTEMIWLALKNATGKDQIVQETRFRNRRVIAIDDLQYAPLMQEIWVSEAESET